MTPRRFLLALALALLGAPFATTQPAAPIPRVGFLAATEPAPVGEAFRQGLRALGHVEDRAVATMIRQRAGAFPVLPDPLFTFHRQRIVELAARHRLPAMYSQREWVDDGGLAAYAASPTELARQAAATVDRVLKGAAPAELPVEAPAKFDFVLNRKTAKALNLKSHESVLRHADELVE